MDYLSIWIPSKDQVLYGYPAEVMAIKETIEIPKDNKYNKT